MDCLHFIQYFNLLFFLISVRGAVSELVYPTQNVQQCGQDSDMVLQSIQKELSTFTDCKHAYQEGQTASGVYTIQPDNETHLKVYCDMDTDGGGWTVFQRRMDGSVPFYRYWVDYEEGFGNLSGEFWLGLKYIHQLTTDAPQELRIGLADFDNETRYAVYHRIIVTGTEDQYRLQVSGYTGTAGESLIYHDGFKFSTKDRDNDSNVYRNCAMHYHGAWWYRGCLTSNLNGFYFHGDLQTASGNGVNWYAWRGDRYSLKKTEMKIHRI